MDHGYLPAEAQLIGYPGLEVLLFHVANCPAFERGAYCLGERFGKLGAFANLGVDNVFRDVWSCSKDLCARANQSLVVWRVQVTLLVE